MWGKCVDGGTDGFHQRRLADSCCLAPTYSRRTETSCLRRHGRARCPFPFVFLRSSLPILHAVVRPSIAAVVILLAGLICGPSQVFLTTSHLFALFYFCPSFFVLHLSFRPQICSVENLKLKDLAPGGTVGRLVIWTQCAFEKLESVYGSFTTPSEKKKGYLLPRPIMANPDVTRVLSSEEVQVCPDIRNLSSGAVE